MIQVLVVFFALAVVGVQSQIKCNQGNATVFEAKNCTDATATKCSKPKFVEYTGYAAVDLACGQCAAGKDVTCLECAVTDGSVCNVLEVAGPDFGCYGYSYTAPPKNSTDLGTYKLGKSLACHRLNTTTDIKCQSPGVNATEATFAKGFCGPCAAGTDNSTCITCVGAKCNSATALTVILLPLVALFYSLF